MVETYPANSQREILITLPIIPTENGKCYSSDEIYLPPEKEHQKVISEIPDHFMKNLKIIHHDLSDALKAVDVDEQILENKYQIRQFSLGEFISKSGRRLSDKEVSRTDREEAINILGHAYLIGSA